METGAMSRTALLIRCTAVDAERIRTEAEKARLTISAYVLGIATKAAELEDRLSKSRTFEPNQTGQPKAVSESGSRTAILVRCDDREAERIREAARHRNLPINAFVLQSLKRTWNAQSSDHAEASNESSR